MNNNVNNVNQLVTRYAIKMMITVISRNIDKVLGFPDVVLIGYSLHSFKSIFFSFIFPHIQIN